MTDIIFESGFLKITPRNAAEPGPIHSHTSRSYAGNWRASAAHPTCPIGVDIALSPPPRDYASVVKEFYHAQEQRAFLHHFPEQQRMVFLASWTMKEAWCKAMKLGITHGLPGPDLSSWMQDGCPSRQWNHMGNRPYSAQYLVLPCDDQMLFVSVMILLQAEGGHKIAKTITGNFYFRTGG